MKVMAHEHVRITTPPFLAPVLVPFVLGCLASLALSSPLEALEEHEFAVRVLGADDTPLDGARVEMWRSERCDGLLRKDGSVPEHVVGRPADRGDYRFPLPLPGVYRFRVDAPGHARTYDEAVVNGPRTLTVRLEAERPIRGVVLDDSGNPIEGAEIHAGTFLFAVGPDSRARSDAGGSFVLHGLSGGENEVCGSKDGFEDEDWERVCPGGPEITLILKPCRPFLGRVVAEEDGQPLPDAIVEVSCFHRTLARTRTDSSGSFRLERLPAARGEARFSHEGFITRWLDGVDFDAARRDGSFVIELRRAPGIRGMLLDALTGAAIDDADIVTWKDAESCQGRTARTGPDGSFHVRGLLPGTQHLGARKKGYVEGQTTLDSRSGTRELCLWLQRGGSIGGRVLDPEGNPLAGARVTPIIVSIRGEKRLRTLAEQTVATDTRGRFLVEGIPRGSTCYLVACRWDRAPVWHGSIELPPTGHAKSIEIRLPGWGSLEGRVAGHAGAPVLVKRDIPACLEEDGDARSLLDAFSGELTDTTGAFTLERVAPGAHGVEVFLENRGLIDAGRILVPEGETAVMEIALDPAGP